MYSWGSSDSGSSGSSSSGSSSSDSGGSYDYGSARGSYGSGSSSSSSSGRSYASNHSVSRSAAPIAVGRTLTCDSKRPIILAVDTTGSMMDWPEIIFEKLPLLDGEVKHHVREAEFCFASICDTGDTYPLQVTEFVNGKAMDTALKSLVCQGGGSGPVEYQEAYELAAYFFWSHTTLPKATHPILILAGDESPHKQVNRDALAQYVGDKLAETLSTATLFEMLKSKYEVYFVQKVPYGSGGQSITEQVTRDWTALLGAERVLRLDDPKRIVDVVIGIVAGVAGSFEDFKTRLATRQTTGQVQQVLKTLHTVAASVASKIAGGGSKLAGHNASVSKKSRALI